VGSAQLDPRGARRNLLVGRSHCACNTRVKHERHNNRMQLSSTNASRSAPSISGKEPARG
jgi:hypothetical protein